MNTVTHSTVPADVTERLTGRSSLADQVARNAMFCAPSLRHGRSLSAALADGRWLSVKGCGWNWGPPWVRLSPKDPELCFGLFDAASGQREIAVSAWLQRHEVHASRSESCLELDDDALAALGVDRHIRYRNDTPIRPCALFTTACTSYRVADLWSEARAPATAELRRVLGSDAPAVALSRLAARLAEAVGRYQSLGAVNDTLNPENVTVAGEVTDFEWFYVPGIPTPDGSRDGNLPARQRKEAIYLVETLIVAASALGLPLSVGDAAGLVLEVALPNLVDGAPALGFMRELLA